MKWLIRKLVPLGIFLAISFAYPHNILIYMYPVLISCIFATALAWSLLYPPTLIERFARLVEPYLDARGIAYTRKVTILWLFFSLLNAAISLCLIPNHKIWIWYNGCISYVLIGLLMGGEYLFRIHYKAQGYIPAHQLLVKRKHRFWKSYWKDPKIDSYPHLISALATKLKESQAQRVFIISEDRAYFLAGCFAGFYAHIPVVIPQLNSPEFLKDLQQPGDVIFTDEILSQHTYETTFTPTFAPLDSESSKIIFYTSGSTGKPKAIEKKLSQLEAEVEVLHLLWSKSKQGSFLSTVSHHHLYAFLYSLLWPICSGCRIERQTFTYWGNVLSKCNPDDFLISSPAHLGRFSILHDCLPANFCRVFSSGAPLTYEAAITSKKYLGVLPMEVYGSTETGGIAFRQQTLPTTPWRRFDCVELFSGSDNKLRVHSPYIEGPFQTEDQIEWVDSDTFHLLGRADRIVKVEGKRVSLTEIENHLCNSPLVSQAAVIVLDKSYRDELGAALVLTEEGITKLQDSGKAALSRHLREVLRMYLHAVVLPRKWRYLQALPINPQGKLLYSSLKEFFLEPVCQPIILSKTITESHGTYALKIPHNLAYLEGHFKGAPIVPGVVQLHWAVDFAKADLGVEGSVSQGHQIKFSNLMKPNDDINLTLIYNKDKSSIAYLYKKGELTYSSGRLIFSGGRAHGD